MIDKNKQLTFTVKGETIHVPINREKKFLSPKTGVEDSAEERRSQHVVVLPDLLQHCVNVHLEAILYSASRIIQKRERLPYPDSSALRESRRALLSFFRQLHDLANELGLLLARIGPVIEAVTISKSTPITNSALSSLERPYEDRTKY